ncbi:MAG: hypothetical protein WBM61_06860, partial [Woeseiaceae bacterium]
MPLSREFDYLPPKTGATPLPGCRVRVPFGRRQAVGMVLGHSHESALKPEKIRRCSEAIDETPVLSEADLRLIRFTSDYYHHPVGEVVAAALPADLRQGKPLHPTVETIAATDAGESENIETLALRAPKQAELLELLVDAGGNGIEAARLTEELPNWRRAAVALFRKGHIGRFEAP